MENWTVGLLGVYPFPLVLEGFQKMSSVQDEPDLFFLVIKFHQHVLNLKTDSQRERGELIDPQLKFLQRIRSFAHSNVCCLDKLLNSCWMTALSRAFQDRTSIPIHQLCFLDFHSAPV